MIYLSKLGCTCDGEIADTDVVGNVVIHYYSVSLDLMLNIHKSRRDLNLQQYTELRIAHMHI